LSKLVHRPVAAANISSPAFFRVTEEMGPTLLIDEADTFLAGNDELRGILNAGYSRETAYVVRVQSLKSNVQSQEPPALSPIESGRADGAREELPAAHSKLARFSCWCPKAIARIGRLPETLADRCIVIRMERKRMSEECERLRELDGAGLRARCERFVEEHGEEIGKARPEIPEGLNDRAADIWEPLLALAKLRAVIGRQRRARRRRV